MHTCNQCAAAYPQGALGCPDCGTLTHAAELEELAARVNAYVAAQRPSSAFDALERMLSLLPPETAQYAEVQERMRELGAQAGVTVGAEKEPKRRGVWGLLAAGGMLLWKFKFVLAFLLTKGKALLLGLTKAKTLLSMLFALGAYWALWGWPFALGFVLSIYVHEMGHVFALRRAGIPASAPMFVPFVGAFVRLHKGPETPEMDARIGLAGPIYGFAAALLCLVLFYATDASLLGAVAKTGAWINLFNLVPVWRLDGGRGFNAMGKRDRWLATAVVAVVWFITGESMLLLLLAGCLYRVFATPPHDASESREPFFTYALLVAALGWIAGIRLPELSGLPS